MEYSYRFRIYPTPTQEVLLQNTFGCVRYVFNHYLAQRKGQYEQTGKAPTRFEQDRDLTKLKKELEWLRKPDKCALQNSLKDLDTAYQNFFRQVKKGEKPGYPRFKSKKDHRKSYRTNSNISIQDGRVKLPKLGLVKCRVSKEVKGRIISATVSQNPSGKYFVSLCCTDVEIEPLEITGAVVGVDLGVHDLAITSDESRIQNNQYLRQSEKKLARLQRELSRKTKGSRRWERQRIKVARMHERIVNQRQDAMQKATTQLVRDYDIICIEDLNVKGMIRNHKLAKSVSDTSFGEFRRQLEYKAKWYGKVVSVIDRFYPSSQLCSECGYRNPNTKDLSVREWICTHCGAYHERDVNAAKNILMEGLRLLEAT